MRTATSPFRAFALLAALLALTAEAQMGLQQRLSSAFSVGQSAAGIESSTGGAVYQLPRDHALHSANPLYKQTNDYMEWCVCSQLGWG